MKELVCCYLSYPFSFLSTLYHSVTFSYALITEEGGLLFDSFISYSSYYLLFPTHLAFHNEDSEEEKVKEWCNEQKNIRQDGEVAE